MSIVLEKLFGLRGTKIAFFVSMVLAGILGIFFFAIQAYLAGSIFFLFTYESYRSWSTTMTLKDQDQDFVLQHLFKEADQEMRSGKIEEACNKFKRIREIAQAGLIYLAASEQLAVLLVKKNEYQAAYDILEPLKSKLSPEALILLHQIAYHLKYWKEAISIGNQVYQITPGYNVALINAFVHSILGQVGPAIGWIKCAMREGIPNVAEVLNQHEFDPIRQEPLFRQFQDKLT